MRILGEDTSDAEKAIQVKRRIGVVPEELALFDNLTGREYLTFIGRMYQMPMATVRQRSLELLLLSWLGFSVLLLVLASGAVLVLASITIIGLIWAIPWVVMVYAITYRQLAGVELSS